ncbi:hypothetical protein JIY74_25345 [Vibrio harveyi]|nr:hypothetical protein [Vibrio harveyi]
MIEVLNKKLEFVNTQIEMPKFILDGDNNTLKANSQIKIKTENKKFELTLEVGQLTKIKEEHLIEKDEILSFGIEKINEMYKVKKVPKNIKKVPQLP